MMTTKKTPRRANVPADPHTPLNITIQPLDKPIVEQAVRYRRESLQADLIYVNVHISIAIDSRCTIHAVIATEYAQNRCTCADKRMDMWIGAAAVLFRVPRALKPGATGTALRKSQHPKPQRLQALRSL